MTTIITRLYPDAATAQSVAGVLAADGQAYTAIDVITRDGAGTLAGRLRNARVGAGAAAAYAGPVGDGRALLVVNAPVAPLGTALRAIRTVNRYPSVSVGLADEDVYIREMPETIREGKVYSGTVFFMSNPHRSLLRGHILGSNPIIHSGPRTSAIRGGAHMSKWFWPGKLVSKPKEGTSVIRGTWLFSSLFGIPTVIRDWPLRRDLPTII
jgi:hypothetical protein